MVNCWFGLVIRDILSQTTNPNHQLKLDDAIEKSTDLSEACIDFALQQSSTALEGRRLGRGMASKSDLSKKRQVTPGEGSYKMPKYKSGTANTNAHLATLFVE